jgi:hypothetical protein
MPVQSVREFMDRIWNEPPKKNTAKLLYRGQAEAWICCRVYSRDTKLKASEIQSLEDRLLVAFSDQSPYLLPSTPNSELEWMSLAQQHGLPTRLMDWSGNPLVALFFAVEQRTPPQPSVWIYYASKKQIHEGQSEPPRQFPRDVEITTIIQPRRHSPRVVAQAGWHTLHRSHKNESGKLRVLALNKMDYHNKSNGSSVD